MIGKTGETFLGTLLTFWFLSWSMTTCLLLLYSIKYFLRGENRIYCCVLSPESPVGTWSPEQREALREKIHVQSWGIAVCFGERAARCQELWILHRDQQTFSISSELKLLELLIPHPDSHSSPWHGVTCLCIISIPHVSLTSQSLIAGTLSTCELKRLRFESKFHHLVDM